MAEVESESEKKRKRSELSSISELDTSSNSPKTEKKQKKKKNKNMNSKTQKGSESAKKEENNPDIGLTSPEVTRQLSEINNKLSNVISKDDGFLREMIKDIFQQMKDEFLKSVSHRIDILEGKLFEKEEENDKLKKEITGLNKEIESQKTENTKLSEQIDKNNETAEGKINDLEQYGRRNNVRMNGVAEVGEETPERTTTAIIEVLNNNIENLALRREDIDIAHRLGKKKNGKHRQIIVKFQSRMKRDTILRNKKLFKGTDIFINEDLTKINQHVLACVRKKMADEVAMAWSKGGRLFYKNKTDAVIEVKYSDYQQWVDLPWPENEDGR